MEQTSPDLQKILSEILYPFMERGTEGWLQFMRDELKYTPDPCMLPIVDDVANFRNTAVRSCHGVGKTTLGGVLVMTAEALVPEVLTLQISPTWSQVKDVFWNEMRRWYPNSNIMKSMFELADKSPRMTCRFAPNDWYAHGIATNSPGKIEGRHAKRVFKVIDENKAVEDGIDEATEGAMTSEFSWRLRLSTPSTPGGKFTKFYLCFTRNRKLWKTHKITAEQSPRVSKAWVERMISEYGEDSQIVKARVFADFPDASGDVLIPLQAAENFYDPESVPRGAVSIGVDVARFGNDECVISVWKGNTEIKLDPFEHKSLVETKRRIIELAKEHLARCIVVDDIGVGGGVTDMLADEYDDSNIVTIVPFIMNGKSRQPNKFKSIGDEVLWEFAQAVKENRVKSLTDDEKRVYQLTSYKIAYTADEKIVIKWPEKRGERASEQPSPDRADATFLGWFGTRLLMAAGITDKREEKEVKKEKDEDEDEGMDEDDEVPKPEFRGIGKKAF